MSDKTKITGLTPDESALILGAMDLAVRHLGAQLQQGGIEAAAEAASKIAQVKALADRVRAIHSEE